MGLASGVRGRAEDKIRGRERERGEVERAGELSDLGICASPQGWGPGGQEEGEGGAHASSRARKGRETVVSASSSSSPSSSSPSSSLHHHLMRRGRGKERKRMPRGVHAIYHRGLGRTGVQRAQAAARRGGKNPRLRAAKSAGARARALGRTRAQALKCATMPPGREHAARRQQRRLAAAGRRRRPRHAVQHPLPLDDRRRSAAQNASSTPPSSATLSEAKWRAAARARSSFGAVAATTPSRRWTER